MDLLITKYLVLSMFLFVGCKNEVVQTYYANGSLMELYEVKKVSNEIDGEYIMYGPQGNISVKYEYNNGKLDGNYVVYCEGSDKVMEEGSYRQDLYDGLVTHYYCDPPYYIKFQLEFKKGKFWNIVQQNDANNNELNKGTLLNGNGTLYKYDDFGKLSDKYNIVNGKKNGWQYSYSGRVDSFLLKDNLDELTGNVWDFY